MTSYRGRGLNSGNRSAVEGGPTIRTASDLDLPRTLPNVSAATALIGIRRVDPLRHEVKWVCQVFQAAEPPICSAWRRAVESAAVVAD